VPKRPPGRPREFKRSLNPENDIAKRSGVESAHDDGVVVANQTIHDAGSKPLAIKRLYISRADLAGKVFTRPDDQDKYDPRSPFSDYKWPTTTDVVCWHCTHSFSTVPLPLPVGFDEVSQRLVGTGIFCSWTCMMTYATEHRMEVHFIPLLRRRMLLDDQVRIPLLVNRTRLRAFGGDLEISEYRNGWDQPRESLKEKAFYVLNRMIYVWRNT
jgi:hypothetical protein